jgi:hypothetical protein
MAVSDGVVLLELSCQRQYIFVLERKRFFFLFGKDVLIRRWWRDDVPFFFAEASLTVTDPHDSGSNAPDHNLASVSVSAFQAALSVLTFLLLSFSPPALAVHPRLFLFDFFYVCLRK